MNERIKLLADATAKLMPSGVYNTEYESGKKGVEFTEDALEKFTELIVNETADWINDNVGMIDEDARADLLKHFGVEQ